MVYEGKSLERSCDKFGITFSRIGLRKGHMYSGGDERCVTSRDVKIGTRKQELSLPFGNEVATKLPGLRSAGYWCYYMSALF